jgi:hypothetical protein
MPWFYSDLSSVLPPQLTHRSHGVWACVCPRTHHSHRLLNAQSSSKRLGGCWTRTRRCAARRTRCGVSDGVWTKSVRASPPRCRPSVSIRKLSWVGVSVYLPPCMSVCVSVSVCLSVCLSVCVCVCLCVCLSGCLLCSANVLADAAAAVGLGAAAQRVIAARACRNQEPLCQRNQ